MTGGFAQDVPSWLVAHSPAVKSILLLWVLGNVLVIQSLVLVQPLRCFVQPLRLGQHASGISTAELYYTVVTMDWQPTNQTRWVCLAVFESSESSALGYDDQNCCMWCRLCTSSVVLLGTFTAFL